MKQSKDATIIHINAHWAFQGDLMSITLLEKKINKKGKLDYYTRGHFLNLQQLFNRLIDMEVGSARSLELIVDRIIDLKHDIFLVLDSLRSKSSDDQEVRDLLDRPGIRPPRKDGT